MLVRQIADVVGKLVRPRLDVAGLSSRLECSCKQIIQFLLKHQGPMLLDRAHNRIQFSHCRSGSRHGGIKVLRTGGHQRAAWGYAIGNKRLTNLGTDCRKIRTPPEPWLSFPIGIERQNEVEVVGECPVCSTSWGQAFDNDIFRQSCHEFYSFLACGSPAVGPRSSGLTSIIGIPPMLRT